MHPVCLSNYIDVIPESKAEDDTPELMVDTPELDNQNKLIPLGLTTIPLHL